MIYVQPELEVCENSPDFDIVTTSSPGDGGSEEIINSIKGIW